MDNPLQGTTSWHITPNSRLQRTRCRSLVRRFRAWFSVKFFHPGFGARRHRAAETQGRWAARAEKMVRAPGAVEITFEFSRHLGPRYQHGAVTILFDGSAPHSFTSTALWPVGVFVKDEVETAIREEVEKVIRERLGSLDSVRVVLKSVRVDPVNSSILGFRHAARAAVEAAFAESGWYGAPPN